MAHFPELDEELEDESMQDGPSPVATIAGPQTPREQVMQRISSVRNSSGDEGQDVGGDQERGAAMQFAKNTALTSGIGRALNTLASGTGFKTDDSAYDALDKQPQVAFKDLDRSALVRRAIEARKGKEAMAEAMATQRDAALKSQERERAIDNKRADEAMELKRQELGLRRNERLERDDERKNKATGDQFKVAGYGKRLQQAEDIFGNLEKSGYSRADTTSGIASVLPSFLQGEHTQEQEQAERNFVNAVLRRESGAAIAPSEFGSAAKQYFPRSGDSPEVIANKKANRQQVMASLQAESGPAWEKIPSVASAPVANKSADGIIPQAHAAGGGPKIGEIKKGFIYTGGDPRDPHSWVKAKQ